MDDLTLKLLHSGMPSERSLAVDRLRHTATVEDLPLLRTARIAETVPSLRRRITTLMSAIDVTPPRRGDGTVVSEPTAASASQFEEEAVHWIRHELEPAIGWLRLAASDELAEFESSETRAAIDGLARRIDSLVALVRASAPPRIQRVSLADMIDDAIATSGVTMRRLSIGTMIADVDISTDPNLLRLALLNAIRNASEAVMELPEGDAQIHIDSGATPETFWIRISNRFLGTEFRLDEVSATGVSAKIGHQGQGFSLMRLVARRLGLKLSLEADGGVADFTIRGLRSFGDAQGAIRR